MIEYKMQQKCTLPTSGNDDTVIEGGGTKCNFSLSPRHVKTTMIPCNLTTSFNDVFCIHCFH